MRVVSSFGITKVIPHSSHGKTQSVFPEILGICKANSVICKSAICRSQGLGVRGKSCGQ